MREPVILPLVRLGWWIAIPLFGGLLACNAILGVKEVELRTTVPRADPTPQNPGDDDDDDDDGTDGIGPTNPNEPDEPTDPLTECDGELACERLMFVTGATFTGNLGGLAGAD